VVIPREVVTTRDAEVYCAFAMARCDLVCFEPTAAASDVIHVRTGISVASSEPLWTPQSSTSRRAELTGQSVSMSASIQPRARALARGVHKSFALLLFASWLQ
jgi:hypothetical protein